MSDLTWLSEHTELTFEQRQRVDEYLEGYKNNLSNSNKFRIGLHAYIDGLLAANLEATLAKLDELIPKKKYILHLTGNEFREAHGFNDCIEQIREAVGLSEHAEITYKIERSEP